MLSRASQHSGATSRGGSSAISRGGSSAISRGASSAISSGRGSRADSRRLSAGYAIHHTQTPTRSLHCCAYPFDTPVVASVAGSGSGCGTVGIDRASLASGSGVVVHMYEGGVDGIDRLDDAPGGNLARVEEPTTAAAAAAAGSAVDGSAPPRAQPAGHHQLAAQAAAQQAINAATAAQQAPPGGEGSDAQRKPERYVLVSVTDRGEGLRGVNSGDKVDAFALPDGESGLRYTAGHCVGVRVVKLHIVCASLVDRFSPCTDKPHNIAAELRIVAMASRCHCAASLCSSWEAQWACTNTMAAPLSGMEQHPRPAAVA